MQKSFRFLHVIFAVLFLSLAICSSHAVHHHHVSLAKRDFGPIQIFAPPASFLGDRCLIARHVMLPDSRGTLLATFDTYRPKNLPAVFFIYRSTDHGFTWNAIGHVADTVNGWGMTTQAFLYVLKNQVGKYAPGTILCAGNSFAPNNTQTKLDIYASTDGGVRWTFVSSIARGGRAIPNNGETPVWEPFLLEADNQIFAFYSDQRQPSLYGQKIVHQTSTDLKTWNGVVNDVVTANNKSARPGMPVVAKLPNGKYIMTYEFFGAPEAAFAVYYKIADHPGLFDEQRGQVIRTNDGAVFTSSPFVVWTPSGGANGTIVVSCFNTTDLLINRDLGDPSKWTRVPVPNSPGAYSRSLAVGFDPRDITITDGGKFGQGDTNKITFNAVRLPSS